MDQVEITIIGAGVVGLAIAAELSKEHRNIVVLERHKSFGQETSSRNSEVIHSGIYYSGGSLKSALCIEGADLLYDYCLQHSIPHARIGKLIVAADESERTELYRLLANGMQNGVRGLRVIEESEITRIEPNVTGLAAICSPNTGIIDSHSLMKCLYNEAASSGAIISFNSEVALLNRVNNGYVVGVNNEGYKFFSRIIINAAGLSSDYIAGLTNMDIDTAGYRITYWKGSYFSYQKKSPVSMFIYPIPNKNLAGLGVHATLNLSDQLHFGPDAERVESIEYTVDGSKRNMFFESASRLIKGLDREAFIPDMSGIRPRISGEGPKDFIIAHEAEKGLEGMINLVGIESPGLTASLAIGRYVKKLINNASLM